MKTNLARIILGCLSAATVSAADSTQPIDRAVWRAYNREVKPVEEGGRKFVRLDARANDGVAWLVGSDFSEGTIEVELRGQDKPGQSFVGVAIHGLDDTTYEAIYFRPFNFKIADLARRQRAVQYISHPKHTWEKLRADSPGKYEQPVSPVPDPNGWFRARIAIEDDKVSVFVDNAATPTLVVTALSKPRNGRIGLWVGNGSSGDFANLRVTTTQSR